MFEFDTMVQPKESEVSMGGGGGGKCEEVVDVGRYDVSLGWEGGGHGYDVGMEQVGKKS